MLDTERRVDCAEYTLSMGEDFRATRPTYQHIEEYDNKRHRSGPR